MTTYGAARFLLASALWAGLVGCQFRGPGPSVAPAPSGGPACGVARPAAPAGALTGGPGSAPVLAAGDILVTVRSFTPDLQGRILQRLAPWGPAGWQTLSPQLGLIHLEHRPALNVLRARLSGLPTVTVQFNQRYRLEAPGPQGPQ